MTVPVPRFIKTVSYMVGDFQQGKHAEWLQAAAGFYPSVGEGLLSWQVLRERTGHRGYLEMFTFTDRDAYHALMKSPEFKARAEELLAKQGQAIDLESFDIRFHDELTSEGQG